MTSVVKALVFLCLLVVIATPSLAQTDTFSVQADSTMDGHAGKLFRIVEDGVFVQALFFYIEGDMVRVHAVREAGAAWEVFASPTYLIKQTNIAVDDNWRFFPGQNDAETRATVIGQEQVNTPAGTFNAWRVDIALISSINEPIETIWWADGVGLVQSVEWAGSWVVWQQKLASFTGSGTGLLPLVNGNTWVFNGADVATSPSTMGSMKSQFTN